VVDELERAIGTMTRQKALQRARSQMRGNSSAILATLAVMLGTTPTGPALLAATSHSTAATRVARTERFQFHSDPWINLHHFLYQWAREGEGLGTGRKHGAVPERSTLASLSETERRSWAAGTSSSEGRG
jgi:hypothetical protein